MNKLPRENRARILHLLCEGNSIRAITRLTGTSKKAVSRLMVEAGQAAAWYQDRVLRNLNCRRIQVALYYNFVRVHKTLRMTPAMAAGVTGRLWEISDVVDVLETWESTT